MHDPMFCVVHSSMRRRSWSPSGASVASKACCASVLASSHLSMRARRRCLRVSIESLCSGHRSGSLCMAGAFHIPLPCHLALMEPPAHRLASPTCRIHFATLHLAISRGGTTPLGASAIGSACPVSPPPPWAAPRVIAAACMSAVCMSRSLDGSSVASTHFCFASAHSVLALSLYAAPSSPLVSLGSLRMSSASLVTTELMGLSVRSPSGSTSAQ